MNRDVFKGQWSQITGKLKQEWGKLTDNDIKTIEGQYDVLVGKLQQHYGYARDEAQKNVDKFLKENNWE